jgi:nucleotide-binding universal stress UspA family protein
MNLRDVLVILDGGAGSDERLRVAVSIARQHQAYLSAVFLQGNGIGESQSGLSLPRVALMAGSSVSFASRFTEPAIPAETAEQRFRDQFRRCGSEGEWHSLDRPDTAELIQIARMADLVIMGQIHPNSRNGPKCRPEEVVIECGRPVLMIPYIGTFGHIGRRVMVAWDGSRSAVRALNDALPVIDDADEVTLLTVRTRPRSSTGHNHSSADRVARHLGRHGIVVQAEDTLRGTNTVCDVLLSRAADFSVDLIVAGANRHSPLREALIGGVSRGLFQHMTVPVLMSH